LAQAVAQNAALVGAVELAMRQHGNGVREYRPLDSEIDGLLGKPPDDGAHKGYMHIPLRRWPGLSIGRSSSSSCSSGSHSSTSNCGSRALKTTNPEDGDCGPPLEDHEFQGLVDEITQAAQVRLFSRRSLPFVAVSMGILAVAGAILNSLQGCDIDTDPRWVDFAMLCGVYFWVFCCFAGVGCFCARRLQEVPELYSKLSELNARYTQTGISFRACSGNKGGTAAPMSYQLVGWSHCQAKLQKTSRV